LQSNFTGLYYVKIVTMYYVYILHSEIDGNFYTGFTRNIEKRVVEHNSGKVKSTKNRIPLKLIYYEAYLEKEDALKREAFLKSGSGKKFIKKQLSVYLSKYTSDVNLGF